MGSEPKYVTQWFLEEKLYENKTFTWEFFDCFLLSFLICHYLIFDVFPLTQKEKKLSDCYIFNKYWEIVVWLTLNFSTMDKHDH